MPMYRCVFIPSLLLYSLLAWLIADILSFCWACLGSSLLFILSTFRTDIAHSVLIEFCSSIGVSGISTISDSMILLWVSIRLIAIYFRCFLLLFCYFHFSLCFASITIYCIYMSLSYFYCCCLFLLETLSLSLLF